VRAFVVKVIHGIMCRVEISKLIQQLPGENVLGPVLLPVEMNKKFIGKRPTLLVPPLNEMLMPRADMKLSVFAT
jgi:hypothetical protein